MPITPSRVPIGAELIRQGRSRTPHIPLASQAWTVAISAPPRVLMDRPMWPRQHVPPLPQARADGVESQEVV